MGAVAARREIHDALMTGAPGAIELFHGFTYSGHPVACAAALATLAIYEREKLLTRAAKLAPAWEDGLHALRGRRHVTDIRNLGLMGAIDLAPRDGAPGARGYEALVKCFHAGALIRITGDTVALSPPLIVKEDEIARLLEVLGTVLDTIE
jgi:beta-alanine--pyruvate transaminase